MDFAYFTPPLAQTSPGYMSGIPYSQSYDESSKFTQEPLDPSFLLEGYDAYRYAPFNSTTPGSPLGPNAQAPIQSVSSVDSGIDIMDEARRASLSRASSEEKETLTPAQSRRKAQNRAAQRAFRDRKERHVRDLEAKLSALESSQQSLQSDNECLKLALQRVTIENEMLRGVTSSSNPTSLHLSTSPRKSSGVAGAVNDPVTLGVGDRGQLLGAGAAWDLIQSHPLVKRGLVDIADVCGRLKRVVRCEGQGPVYEESLVWRVVEESNRGGGDELI